MGEVLRFPLNGAVGAPDASTADPNESQLLELLTILNALASHAADLDAQSRAVPDMIRAGVMSIEDGARVASRIDQVVMDLNMKLHWLKAR